MSAHASDRAREKSRTNLAGGRGALRLVDYASQRLRKLCMAVGFGGATDNVVQTFRGLLSPWGDMPVGQPSKWVSEISDDNTPIEFSVAVADGRAEVRVLFEPQGDEPTLSAYRVAALELSERLEDQFGADLRRFRLVSDLFLPVEMQGPFAAWSSVAFSPGRAPSFKAYFNAQAWGPGRAQSLVEEALLRLGLRRAWPALSRSVLRRGPYLDELKYFALDLTSEAHARVKVYVRHHAARPADLEAASSAAESYLPGEALDFARVMRGGDAQLQARAPFTCSSFVGERDARPASTTVYVPVCAYARDDEVVRARVHDYLMEKGLDPWLYNSIAHGFANRALDTGVGMQSWIALRRYQGHARFTVYLGTEASGVFPPGGIPAGTPDHEVFPSAEQVIRCVASHSLADHPFVRRLWREVDCGAPLWLMITNTYEGTSKHFVRWLANVTARVDDDRLRCLLARQLDQELGEGDLSRAHSFLMRDFLDAIEPMRPGDFSEAKLASGRRLGERLGRHYMSDEAFEGLGALMAGELCAEQLIRAVGQLLGRQSCRLDSSKLEWLRQHNELEGDHAEESFTLARLVPPTPSAVASLQRGAMGLHHALWESLDELYVACFGATEVRDEGSSERS
jgi:pyrroloquinoline quinone (PQQ) biosynthesis protein C